jgi:hypothetical protein
MKKLRSLAVRDTSVTAKDLPMIERLSQQMQSLSTIMVSGRSFSGPVVVEWQRALPRVSVQLREKMVSEEDSAKLFAPVHPWWSTH